MNDTTKMNDEYKPTGSHAIMEHVDNLGGEVSNTAKEKDGERHHDDRNGLINASSKCTVCRRIVARADSLLERYTNWASSSFNTDKGIKLIAYLTWFFSRMTSPSSSSSSSSCGSSSNSNDVLSSGLRKIYSDMMMVRYALRLFGLPMSLEAVRTGSWYSGWKDRYIIILGKIMSWAMVFYYPYEHAAYLHWMAPKLVRADAERCTAISCRFWLAYVFADLASSVLKIKELIHRRNNLPKMLCDNEVSLFNLEIGLIVHWIY
jgi:hypothetical protein